MNDPMFADRPFFITWTTQSTSSTFEVVAAREDEFELTDGSLVYDFLSTSFQTSFGHSHPQIIQRIGQQLGVMSIASPKAEFSLKREVSLQLLSLLGFEQGKLFYTVSGAESVENALKIARQIKGRNKIMARQRSYHGASLGALSVTGDWRNAPHFTCVNETVRFPEPDQDPNCEQLRQLFEQHRDATAGLIIETITGANGVVIPPESWYGGVQKLCREYNVFLILDEVLCGFGRTGKAFAFQHYPALQPDMVCMSKAISGGYIPFGAVWTSQEIANFYAHRVFSCGLTNYAHPLGLAATQAVVEIWQDPDFQTNLARCEQLFSLRLNQLQQEVPMVTQIRQKGMLAAIEFACDAPTWELGMKHGMHLLGSGNMNVLAPPLTTTPERLESALTRYSKIAKACKLA